MSARLLLLLLLLLYSQDSLQVIDRRYRPHTSRDISVCWTRADELGLPSTRGRNCLRGTLTIEPGKLYL